MSLKKVFIRGAKKFNKGVSTRIDESRRKSHEEKEAFESGFRKAKLKALKKRGMVEGRKAGSSRPKNIFEEIGAIGSQFQDTAEFGFTGKTSKPKPIRKKHTKRKKKRQTRRAALGRSKAITIRFG